MDTFQISLVESEFGKELKKGKTVKLDKIHLDDNNLSHAFICKKVSLSVDIKKVTDILRGEKESKDKVLPLYVSRNQLKRHTSSFANFTIEIDFISQQVNMPLLRLVNQIVTMHLNAKETSEELREKKQSMIRQGYIFSIYDLGSVLACIEVSFAIPPAFVPVPVPSSRGLRNMSGNKLKKKNKDIFEKGEEIDIKHLEP